MKLNTFNKLNCSNKVSYPQVSLNKKGTVNFNRAFINLSGFKTGDKICFSQDEDAPENWYIHLGADGFVGRINEHIDRMIFNSTSLKNTFCACFGFNDEENHRFRIADEPIVVDGQNYWLILTGVINEEEEQEEVETNNN